MSCESSCGPLVVTLLTGVPGMPGSLGTVVGDVRIVSASGVDTATVVGIRGRQVADATPAAEQIYQFNGTEWVPTTYTAGTY
jgi:hypothetical protein